MSNRLRIVFGFVPYGAAHGTNTEAGVRKFERIRVANDERRKLKLLEDGFPFPLFFSLRGFKLVPAQAVFFDSLHGFDDIGIEGFVFDFRVLLVKVGGRCFKNAGHFWKGKELDAAEFVFLFSLDDSLVDGLAGVFDLPFGGKSFGDFGLDLRIFVCVSFLFNLRDADAAPLTFIVAIPPPVCRPSRKRHQFR